MRLHLPGLVCAAVVLVAPLGGCRRQPATVPDASVAGPVVRDDAVAAGDQGLAFSLDFFRHAAPAQGNALVSGESLRDALGLTYLGARADTAAELRRALRLSPTPDAELQRARAQRAAWENARGAARLSIANRLWADGNEVTFAPGYAARALEGYGAEATGVPFASAPESARGTINGWVADQTAGKIAELLPPGSVGADTRVVVTNAVYFKGAWRTPFTPKATTDEPFHVGGGTPAPVATMHLKAQLPFTSSRGVSVLQLPYDESHLAMLLVLPDAVDGLGALEASLDAATLEGWARGLEVREVRVALPKFTFRFGGSVRAALEAMGLRRAFRDADFSGLATRPTGLALSDVFHETFIAVDEAGTEAAAATGGTMAITSLIREPDPAVFQADHPFLFFIRDTRTGAVLFTGRVADPRSE